MKKLLLTIITTLPLLFSGNIRASVKTSDTVALNNEAINGISTKSYTEFKKGIMPLIKVMGTRRIIGMGEGTHGTAEFYKVRFWLSRILVENYGFTRIALENDWSDSRLLNDELGGTSNLDSLMKKRLLSIWQNQETKEMLSWVKTFNKTHKRPVTIDGLDYVFLNVDHELINRLIGKQMPAAWADSLQVIAKACAFQDAVWENMNHPKQRQLDGKAMNKSSALAYLTTDWLSRQVTASDLNAKVKADVYMALENIKEGFTPFYADAFKKPEATRDSLMAYNARLILKGNHDKMIIWAHNGHMAKTGIYNNEVGGTGGYIQRMFPGQYMVVGTSTATGTFAATKQRYDSYTNPMAAYPLDTLVKTSWETCFIKTGKPAFYVIPAEFNPGKFVKPFRFIGYGPDSSPGTNDNINLSDHFDALIFIKDTHAATPLK